MIQRSTATVSEDHGIADPVTEARGALLYASLLGEYMADLCADVDRYLLREDAPAVHDTATIG